MLRLRVQGWQAKRLILLGIAASLVVISNSYALDPADQRLAFRAQIRLSDLPSGWRTAKDTSNESSKCLGPRVKASGRSYRDFAKGEYGTLKTAVGVFRSETQAKQVYATLTSDHVWDCVASEIKKSSGAKSVQQGRTLLHAIGAPSVGREIVFVVDESGARATGFIHLNVARKGRAVMFVFDGDVFSPPLTSSEEETLLRRMVTRVSGKAPSSAAAAPRAGTRKDPHKVRTLVTLPEGKGWKLRVNKTIANATSLVLNANQFNDRPASGRQFFIINVTFVYTGNGSDTPFAAGDLQAVGKSNVSYTQGDDSCGVIPGELQGFKKVFRGGRISGNICFSVRTSDARSLLLFYEPLFSLKNTQVFFALR